MKYILYFAFLGIIACAESTENDNKTVAKAYQKGFDEGYKKAKDDKEKLEQDAKQKEILREREIYGYEISDSLIEKYEKIKDVMFQKSGHLLTDSNKKITKNDTLFLVEYKGIKLEMWNSEDTFGAFNQSSKKFIEYFVSDGDYSEIWFRNTSSKDGDFPIIITEYHFLKDKKRGYLISRITTGKKITKLSFEETITNFNKDCKTWVSVLK